MDRLEGGTDGWNALRTEASPPKSQAEIGQAGMLCRPWTAAIPVKLPVGLADRRLIDAGMSLTRQAVLVEFLVLVSSCFVFSVVMAG